MMSSCLQQQLRASFVPRILPHRNIVVASFTTTSKTQYASRKNTIPKLKSPKSVSSKLPTPKSKSTILPPPKPSTQASPKPIENTPAAPSPSTQSVTAAGGASDKILVYNSGMPRLLFHGLMRYMSVSALFVTSAAVIPGFAAQGFSGWGAPLAIFASSIPLLYCSKVLTSQVQHIRVWLPEPMYKSNLTPSYISSLPTTTPVSINNLNTLGFPRRQDFKLGDLRRIPAKRSLLGLSAVNLEAVGKPLQNPKKRWFARKPRTQFWVEEKAWGKAKGGYDPRFWKPFWESLKVRE